MADAYIASCREAERQPLDAVVQYLSSSIREVHVAGNSTPIRQMKRLLQSQDLTLATQAIANSSQPLAVLNFSYNAVDDAGITQIADNLSSLNVINVLDVRSNDFSTADWFQKLHVRNARLDGNRIGSKGTKAVAAVLAKSTSLQSLSISRCDVGIDGLIALFAAAASSLSLSSLDVSEPLLTSRNEEAAYHAADMLKASPSLVSLAMRKTPHLTHSGLEHMLASILANPVLISLDLGANRLGPPAGLLLATAMAKGLCVRHLLLGSCQLGDEGAVALARVISSGQCALETLDLSSNNIGDEGMVALAQALDSAECRLKSLKVWGNPGLELIPGGRPGIEAMAQWQGLMGGDTACDVDFRTYYVDDTAHAAQV